MKIGNTQRQEMKETGYHRDSEGSLGESMALFQKMIEHALEQMFSCINETTQALVY